MTAEEVYEKYKIMPNLRDHMYRVTAVASIICDSLNQKIDKDSIIKTCLLHDMGNIVKSDFSMLSDLIKEHELGYWQGVKEEYIQKYGEDDHKTTMKIIQEIKMPERVVELADEIDFDKIPNLESKDLETQICLYADARVNPYGIVSMESRYDEARKRYMAKPGNVYSYERWAQNKAIMDRIEKNIFSNSKLKPEDITDKLAAPIIAELHNYVIK